MSESEERLDQVFINAFDTNHHAMLDWVSIKFKLKELSKLQQEKERLREALKPFAEHHNKLKEMYNDVEDRIVFDSDFKIFVKAAEIYWEVFGEKDIA